MSDRPCPWREMVRKMRQEQSRKIIDKYQKDAALAEGSGNE